MGLVCWLYKNSKGRWTISADLGKKEIFNKYLWQLLGEDVIASSQTERRVHAETRFTNIKDLLAALRKACPIN